MDERRLRRGLAVAAGVCFAVAFGAIPYVGPASPHPAGQVSTTEGPAPAPGGATGRPARRPPAFRPPAAGSYRYAALSGATEQTAVTRVEDLGAASGEARQAVTEQIAGIELTSRVAWRGGDGGYVLDSTLTTPVGQGVCDWQPDLVELRLPLRVGQTWSSTASCTASGLGLPVTITRTISGRVLGTEEAAIAGRTLAVFRIARSDRIELQGQVAEQQGFVRFSPALGLAVTDEGTASGGGSVGQPYRRVLQNATPE
jgi:hypothetical protein